MLKNLPKTSQTQLFILAHLNQITWKDVPSWERVYGRVRYAGTIAHPHIGFKDIYQILTTLRKRKWVKFHRVEKQFNVRYVPRITEDGEHALYTAILDRRV